MYREEKYLKMLLQQLHFFVQNIVELCFNFNIHIARHVPRQAMAC